jgi:RimJ/RimL family protein N-acetyltransferase
MSIRLETERLIIRTPVKDDAEAIARAINHPEIARTTLNIPHPYSVADAHKWLESHSDPGRIETEVNLCVFLKETGELIGGNGVMGINKKHGKAEIGYWCAVAHWGRGYTTEASRRVLQYCFEELDLNRVHAVCMVSNPASYRVMEKLGMTREGVARKEYQKNDVFEDYFHYAILRSDWEKERRR